MTIEGIQLRHRKKKHNHLQMIKAMAKADGRDVLHDVELPVIKKRKPRAKETKPRNMAEKRLERDIILSLELKGYVMAKSGESSIYNSQHILHGMADLQVFGQPNGIVFLEVKVGKHGQTGKQPEFELLCKKNGLKYVVVKSIKEALEAVES